MLGAPLAAMFVLGHDLKKIISKTASEYTKILPVLLLIVALGLTFYQIRFYPFAYVFAVIPLAGWIAEIYEKTKSKNPGSVIYLAALVTAVPAAWTVPGIIMEPFEKAEHVDAKAQTSVKCASESVVESFNALPIGTIAADSDMTGFILNRTSHRALSGNYHRNWKGIAAEIKIAISDPKTSKKLLMDNNIHYLYYCSSAVGTSSYIRYNKNGLIAKIAEGDIPNYLETVSLPDLENGQAIIFRVKQP